MNQTSKIALLYCLLLQLTAANAQEGQRPKPVIDSNGTVHVPAYLLPPSCYMSFESKKALPREATDEKSNVQELIAKGEIPALRKAIIQDMQSEINQLKIKFPVKTTDTIIGNTKAIKIYPAGGVSKANEKRVLINLHSGGFLVGSPSSMGLTESIPLASMAEIMVISIEYKQAPAFVFPAATIDVLNVYASLLKTYRPENIGIYGCSAGGLLTAQAVAWFVKEGIPVPGAIGILCASADASWGGDSWFWQKPLSGRSSSPELDERFYYGSYNLDDSLMSPVKSATILKKFPPTILMTSTRSPELSAAVNTHRELTKANADARLYIWDGLWHAFLTNSALPESQEAVTILAGFFNKTLGRSSKKTNIKERKGPLHRQG